MQCISGKPIADQILSRVRDVIHERGIMPGLAVVLVGHDPASEMYVGLKERAAQSVGVHFEKHLLPATTQTAAICSLIRRLNQQTTLHGIIVQLPLPSGIDTAAVIAAIQPEKDADGFHPETVARFLAGTALIPPVFPRALLTLLESTALPLAGKHACILANSNLFAQVMSKTLSRHGIHTSEHLSLTPQAKVEECLRSAEIVISATGTPHFLTGQMVRSGAVIIDGGITRVGAQVMGDAEPKSFQSVDGYITPVPGGVGPVTVAWLIGRVTELALGGGANESIL